MAVQPTLAVPAIKVKSLDTGVYNISNKWQLPQVAQNDSMLLFTFPHAGRCTGVHLKTPASLGAASVHKLQKRDVDTTTAIDITAPTTAATASVVNNSTIGPFDFKAGDTIELLVTGGQSAVQGSANVETDLIVQHA